MNGNNENYDILTEDQEHQQDDNEINTRDQHCTAQNQTKVLPWSCTCACMESVKTHICVSL